METALHTHSVFGNLMFSPSSSWQVFGNALLYSGDSAITEATLDPSSLPQQPLGLNYPLAAETMSQFSSIDVERFRAALGFNVNFGERIVWNAVGEYGNFSDLDPYLYSTDGNRFFFRTGVIFLW